MFIDFHVTLPVIINIRLHLQYESGLYRPTGQNNEQRSVMLKKGDAYYN